MGRHAADLLGTRARRASPLRVLTHCNTGGLATGGYGSALGAVRDRLGGGLVEHVWVDETRPLLQGARLTAWELDALGIPFSVIVDGEPRRRSWRPARSTPSSPAPTGSRRTVTSRTRSVPTGSRSPRVTTVAVLRGRADLDARSPSGDRRGHPDRGARSAEVSARFPARNPAFDVTPAALVAAIVTEVGVHRAPYESSLPAPVPESLMDVDRETACPRAVRLRRAAVRVAPGSRGEPASCRPSRI